jgi:hypothetical protein
MNKNYFFHNCIKENDSDDDKNNILDDISDDISDEDKIDTEYKDIDIKTNKKNKNIKIKSNKIKSEEEKINDLFKSFSMFT